MITLLNKFIRDFLKIYIILQKGNLRSCHKRSQNKIFKIIIFIRIKGKLKEFGASRHK